MQGVRKIWRRGCSCILASSLKLHVPVKIHDMLIEKREELYLQHLFENYLYIVDNKPTGAGYVLVSSQIQERILFQVTLRLHQLLAF